jgi:hypothetical protein
MDIERLTGTSRNEDPLRDPKADPSQNVQSSLSALSSCNTSPFTPDDDEEAVKVDSFDSFLDFFRKKYVSSWTRANTESD